jgi:SAM-dependent methyltransferase
LKGFDRIARPYRWAEYASFGPILSRCRFQFLPCTKDADRALVLGDGDGRFTAALLGAAPRVIVDAVDQSSEMLRLLAARCASDRVNTHHIDAMHFDVCGPYDLIVTHFFLDCLSTLEVQSIALRIAAGGVPGTRWLISEFDVPSGAMYWPARLLVRSLYLAFRALAGLHVQQLPAWRTALSEAGFRCVQTLPRLRGILVAEMWELRPTERVR